MAQGFVAYYGVMMEPKTKMVVEDHRPIVDTKTVVIGGGILAAIAYLIFGRGKNGGGAFDKQPLTFRLRTDGLFLDKKKVDVTDAISRVFAGKRNDMVLIAAGDVQQGIFDSYVEAFQNAGIKVLRNLQTVSSGLSLYSRGRS